MNLSLPTFHLSRPRQRRAFTLLELLVVIGLIAVFSFVLISGLGGGKSAALQSAQATLANMVTAARIKSAATGCRVRVLIHADTNDVARFRRTLVLQQETAPNANAWNDPILVTSLPDGVYVLPYRSRIPTGFYDNQAAWTKHPSSAPLESSSLSTAPVIVVIESQSAASWDSIQFTPAGTLSYGTGDMVLASGRPRPPGSYLAGESPVQVANPDGIRGLTISTYGTPVLVNDRLSF
jgi:prepilin-type N-terminal cleavage/methylation domain-containing protein